MVMGRVGNPRAAEVGLGNQNMSDSKTQGRGKRPHREPLDPKWVEALLHAKPDPGIEALEAVPSLYQQLEDAREVLRRAVEQARVALIRNPLADVAAREAARLAGKRGAATVVVDDDGHVMLEVRYKGDAPATKPRAKAAAKKPWVSALPSLKELREQAEALGLDVSDCGRAKKKILDRIEAAKVAKPKPRQKMTKTAPALSPVRIVTPPEPPAKPPEPPAKLAPGSMAALAAQGEKAAGDLDDFLASIEDIE